MRTALGAVALLIGCGFAEDHPSPSMDRWADERLWPVLEAQEHRDTDALCTLLKNTAPEVREAAALAFASVQDTNGIPCLLNALGDAEARVRATAVFALGFVADSLTVERMAEAAMNETDTTVQRAYLSASFLAMQRRGMLREPNAIIHFLHSSSGQDRVRAADALRRLPDSVLVRMEEDYLRLVEEERDVEVKAMLVRGIGVFRSGRTAELLLRSMSPEHPNVLRVNAVRALSNREGLPDAAWLLDQLEDPVTRTITLEVLQRSVGLDTDKCLQLFEQVTDTTTRIALLGWALNLARSSKQYKTVWSLIAEAEKQRYGPYREAEFIRMRWMRRWEARETMRPIIFGDAPPVVRLAALEAWFRAEEGVEYELVDPEGHDRWHSGLMHSTLLTGDAGMIAALCELMLQEKKVGYLKMLLDDKTAEEVRRALHPIRDLEALQLLDQAIAKRDGFLPPAHQPPPFNHPIDKEKLRVLPQGQRYRIVTPEGTIVIATDVNEAPGSSLVFDSLVTAGYYDGKYFHRMVPNFVVQGGCPRGDGYGGMPWTLRTEIGRKPFTTGSVGLASAGRDTESCQFFITHSATPHLDGRYTRFGEVVSGMDVVWRLQVGDVMEKVERLP